MHCFWNVHDTPVRYIELSGKSGFEKFIDSTEDGAISGALKAQKRFGITFHTMRIPKLLATHKLKRVVGIDFGSK